MYKIKQKSISPEEMNEHLKYVKDRRNIIFEPTDGYVVDNAYIEDKTTLFKLTYRKGDEVVEYSCNKDGKENIHTINGCDAYATMSRYHKTKDYTEDKYVRKCLSYNESTNKFQIGAETFMYMNPDYENKINQAISYDVNSSYPWAMCQPMPNTDVPYRQGEVKPGEVGFCINNGYLVPVFKGHSHFIFPLIESPYKRFIDAWYNRKKNAKDKIEKQKAKDMMNFSVGMLQRHNPFIRCMILYWSNKKIKDLMDENTIYCNTDCIVSLVPREDIPVGKELGQFKVEHQGIFKYIGFNYQWNMDTPSIRGVPKAWFRDDFDLLRNSIPEPANLYEFNKSKFRLEKHNGKRNKKI